MIRRTMLFALLAAAPFRLHAADAVPAWEEPRHRLVFEKGDIKIFNTSVPAGDTTLFHFHEHPTLYVLVRGARVRNQDFGREWVEPGAGPTIPDGAFLYRDYAAEPQSHRVQNIDDHSFQVIGVVNLGAGGDAAPAPAVAPEVQNRWFDGYRFKLRAGESTETHRHAHPVLVVQPGAGNSAVIERGWPSAEKTVGGTWSVHDAGVEHSLKNLGATDLELVEIEMK
jgi:mannose-6-phosphate isomerase-like protein (cupin superfamily)